MSECTTSARCTDSEYKMAQESGLLVISVQDEMAIHAFAEKVRRPLIEALIDCRKALELANFTQELAVVDAAINNQRVKT